MKISIVLNCDTRSGFLENNTVATQMFSGCVSEDFLTDGLKNKINFFDGFEKEVVLFVDQHNPIPEKTIETIQSLASTVVIRKHTNEPLFNDRNYLEALSLCRGDIIAHFDQDVSAFTSSPLHVQNLINLLDTYDYVSYPSHWSPRAVDDPSYNYNWCSTRFFMCKRETLDFNEINRCFDYNHYIKEYPVSKVNPWMEHWLGAAATFKGKGVYYPPVELNDYAIFSWSSYEKYTLRRLNLLPYEEVKKFIHDCGGVQYPCDIKCI